MRTYALYERSRKVLTLYITIAVVILVVACVSLNLDGNNDLPSRSIADSVVYSGYHWVEKMKTFSIFIYT